MKILVIQFARLGDIYMSWPAARALRRRFPQAEIHLLVRPRFEAAAEGLEAVDRVISFPTAHLLAPLLGDDFDLASATGRTEEVLGSLRDEAYDKIVNFSFSPLSSWVVKSIASPGAEILGYDRHADGSLRISDDVSAFFYAQVGTDRPNRVHLTDLFATMIDTDLVPADWRAPKTAAPDFGLPPQYWVLHAGASEGHKRVEPWQWARLVQEYASFCEQEPLPVVLIGSADEDEAARAIQAGVNRVPVLNLCGKTTLLQTFGLLKKAALLVGADSAPLHMASLTGTPTFNISAGAVNFWETGPKAPLSWVYRLNKDAAFPSALLGARVALVMNGGSAEDLLRGVPGTPSFESRFPLETDFAWEMIRALYLGTDFPVADDLRFIQVIEKLREMNDVVLEQLENPRVPVAALGPLMDRADQVFQALAGFDPASAVIIRWIQTEKSRIAPGNAEGIRAQMTEHHRRLAAVLKPYCLEDELSEGKNDGEG